MKRQKKIAAGKSIKETAIKPDKVPIRKLPTGVRGLDEIMGGGLPELPLVPDDDLPAQPSDHAGLEGGRSPRLRRQWRAIVHVSRPAWAGGGQIRERRCHPVGNNQAHG